MIHLATGREFGKCLTYIEENSVIFRNRGILGPTLGPGTRRG